MKDKLREYIDNNFGKKKRFSFSFKKYIADECCDIDELDEKKEEINDDISSYIDNNKNKYDFKTLLFYLIDSKDLKDSDVYNKVHIDRRVFNKIKNKKGYHPSKETVILLGFALELNEKGIEILLESASYSLPKNNYYDLIIRFCFINGIYELIDVNDLLDEYNCKLFRY